MLLVLQYLRFRFPRTVAAKKIDNIQSQLIENTFSLKMLQEKLPKFLMYHFFVHVTAQWVLTTQEYRLKYKNFSYVVQTSLSYLHQGDLRIRTISEEHLREFFFGDEIVGTFKQRWKQHQSCLADSLPKGFRLASDIIDLGPHAVTVISLTVNKLSQQINPSGYFLHDSAPQGSPCSAAMKELTYLFCFAIELYDDSTLKVRLVLASENTLKQVDAMKSDNVLVACRIETLKKMAEIYFGRPATTAGSETSGLPGSCDADGAMERLWRYNPRASSCVGAVVVVLPTGPTGHQLVASLG